MSGHAATTLTRMGFNLGKDRDQLVVPIYYHKDLYAPENPKTTRYPQRGDGAARVYIEKWLNPRGDEPRFGEVDVRGSAQDHSSVYFPSQEKCLFVTEEGLVTLGLPTPQTHGLAMEVDGYAIRFGEAWSSPNDLYGTPDSHQQAEPHVFHPLTLEKFFFDTVQWCIDPPTGIRRAIYRPGSGVEFLDKEKSFYPYLCRLFPCHCGRQRKTVGKCKGVSCRGTFCEHCVINGSFHSVECRDRTLAARESKEEIEKFTSL